MVSKDEDFYLDNLAKCGFCFLGNYTPESAGDYAWAQIIRYPPMDMRKTIVV